MVPWITHMQDQRLRLQGAGQLRLLDDDIGHMIGPQSSPQAYRGYHGVYQLS